MFVVFFGPRDNVNAGELLAKRTFSTGNLAAGEATVIVRPPVVTVLTPEMAARLSVEAARRERLLELSAFGGTMMDIVEPLVRPESDIWGRSITGAGMLKPDCVARVITTELCNSEVFK